MARRFHLLSSLAKELTSIYHDPKAGRGGAVKSGVIVMRKIMLGIAFCALVSASSGQAAIINETFTLNASDFQDVFGSSTPPYSTLTATFSVNFDNSSNINNATSGVMVSYSSIGIISGYQLGYNASTDVLTIAPHAISGGCGYEENQFCTFIYDISTMPNLEFAGYENNGELYVARSLSFGTPSVPEPASWCLMLGGFGMIGGAMRSRKKVAATFA